MVSRRGKTRSTQSQTCVKYRGILPFIKRNTDVNTGDLIFFYVKIRLISTMLA